MAREIIDIGTTGNDGTGDDLRTGATKINNNFQELYSDVGALQVAVGDSVSGVRITNRGIEFEGDSPSDAFQTFFGVTNPTADRTILLPDDSGTVALISDITSIIDSAYISLLTGVAQDSGTTITLVRANSIDSAEAIQIIDSAYISARVNPALFLDSNDTINLIDSAYVQQRQDYAYSSLTGAPNVLDSSDIVKFTIDSGEVVSIINSNVTMGDSADIIGLVDSDYVQTRADHLKLRVYTVAQANLLSASAGEVIYVSDGASGSPCLAVYDGSNWKRIALGTTIST